jgi:hypothetical protein
MGGKIGLLGTWRRKNVLDDGEESFGIVDLHLVTGAFEAPDRNGRQQSLDFGFILTPNDAAFARDDQCGSDGEIAEIEVNVVVMETLVALR